MKWFGLVCLFFLGSCIRGPSISTVSQRQENGCHVMKVPKGWKVHNIGSDGAIAVLTRAEPASKPMTYMVVGAYGHCYNIYEEQPSSP